MFPHTKAHVHGEVRVQKSLEVTTGDYGALVRRRWLLVIGGALVGLGLAVAVLAFAPASYSSTTSVLVSPTGSDATITNGKSTSEINLDTEAQIVRSSVVAGQAANILDDGESRSDLVKRVSVSVPANTAVLNISFAASTPRAAQKGASAFARAYLANRKSVEETRVKDQVDTLKAKIDDLNKQLRATSAAFDRAPSNAERSFQATQRALLIGQIRANTQALNPLQDQDVIPGAVITDASLPTSPSGFSVPVVLTSGLILGLLLGVAAAFVRDRADRRIRTRSDMEQLGIDVLVSQFDLPAPADVLRQNPGGDEALRQCRNALLARIPQHRGIVLVTGVSADNSGASAAASLAVTLARSGVSTALVCCNTHYDITADAPLVLDNGPTLTDVLRSGVAPARAMHPVPELPDLVVVPPGRDGALHSGLLQAHTIGPALEEIGSLVEVVVVDVAPTAVNADAQTVVPSTLGMLLVASADHSTSGDVVEAVDQMTNVNATLLGAVLVRVRRARRRQALGKAKATRRTERSRDPEPTA